jgi:hypothetical protein
MSYRLCKECGQPMLPKGWKKKPFEFDHARDCPLSPRRRPLAPTSPAATQAKPSGGAR